MLVRALFAVLAFSPFSQVRAIHLSSDRYDKVVDVMHNIARFSWENGTKAQAILEAQYPSLSVFSPTSPLPLPASLPSGDISQIIDIAQTTLNNRPQWNVSVHGGRTLLEDGAAADPASLGVAVLLANASTGNATVNGLAYGQAAQQELNYLLYDVPRTTTGAISHRADQAQCWADFIYMVPPFLAYYGALTNNQTLLEEAHRQCSLYRDILRTDNGLWAHILLGNGTHDPGLWATGNAWAAAGMLRVLATMQWSSFSQQLGSQINDLRSWTTEIIAATQNYASSNHMLHNYLDDTSTFEESSATALIAAAAFRLSTLNQTTDFVNYGVNLLSAVSSKVNSTGYVTQVVNPYDFSKQGPESAEAQSFVVMAYAAYNEWDKMGRPGSNTTGSDDPLGSDSGALRSLTLSSVLGAAVVGVLGWAMV